MTTSTTTIPTHQHQSEHDHHDADIELYDRTLFGFWICPDTSSYGYSTEPVKYRSEFSECKQRKSLA